MPGPPVGPAGSAKSLSPTYQLSAELGQHHTGGPYPEWAQQLVDHTVDVVQREDVEDHVVLCPGPLVDQPCHLQDDSTASGQEGWPPWPRWGDGGGWQEEQEGPVGETCWPILGASPGADNEMTSGLTQGCLSSHQPFCWRTGLHAVRGFSQFKRTLDLGS